MSVKAWRPVVGWEGVYVVSDCGSVRRAEDGARVLKPSYGNRGHERVTLFHGRRRRTYYVHQLVAAAFIGPRPAGNQVRHLNGICTDNRAVNLSYGTASQNVLDSVTHGTHHEARKTHCPAGHVYDAINTYVRASGGRVCRPCHREHQRRYLLNKQAVA